MKRARDFSKAPRKHHETHHSVAGFTLVEMLVSLALIVLLVAMLPNALGLGRRAWEAHEDAGERVATVTTASFIEQRLSEAMPVFATDVGSGIAFRGETGELMFVAPSRVPGATGLARWTLRLATTGGGGEKRSTRLQLTAEPYATSAEAGREPAQITFFGPAGGTLNLAYFGQLRDSEPAQWHESWPRIDALPKLVAITLPAAADQSQRSARRMIVALKLASP